MLAMITNNMKNKKITYKKYNEEVKKWFESNKKEIYEIYKDRVFYILYLDFFDYMKDKDEIFQYDRKSKVEF
jgi:hypothetical protein